MDGDWRTRYRHVPGYHCQDCDLATDVDNSKCRNCGEEMRPAMVLVDSASADRVAREHGKEI